MVLTVTLNPLLENRFFYNKINHGEINRSGKNIYKAGGKGINVSRQLNFLGIPNNALTFSGGTNGKIFRSVISSENINATYISTSANLRTASLVIEEDENQITSFFEPNPVITKKEADDFKKKLEKMIVNSSIVVFAGSSPGEAADDIFCFGIEKANQMDKVSILDTYGNHLKNCIDAGPTIIHNNVDEVKSFLNIDLKTEKDKIEFLDYLYSKNVKLSYITDGKNPGYASKYDFHYKFANKIIEEIDATGSGDAFVAGLSYGLEKSLVFEDFLKAASALGAANASEWNTCSITYEKMKEFYDGVLIETIGKKMKIIDDSPNY